LESQNFDVVVLGVGSMNNLHKKGFTLLEIMVTIVIIGTLASIAIPKFADTLEITRSAEGIQTLTALLHAQQTYWQENYNYATNAEMDQMDIIIPATSSIFDAPNLFNPSDPVNNPIVNIQRQGALYTLAINEEGTIRCSGNAGLCSKMGIKTSF